MVKKRDKTPKKPFVVVFVEGDTDIVFFRRLIRYYGDIMHSTPSTGSGTKSATALNGIPAHELINIKGVSRYGSSKIICELQNRIIPKLSDDQELYAVGCSYDTDVFEKDQAPNINWKKLEKDTHKLGVKEFRQIEVKSCIEDWLLDDLDNVCKYLKIKVPTKKLSGTDGYKKLLSLYKLAGKVYFKGNDARDMIEQLDILKIRNLHKAALKGLEDILGVIISENN